MKILNLQQGSEEWHNVRATHFTASDAAAVLGFSKYKSKQELLEEKAFGKKKENSGSEYIFQKGHEAEEKARPLIEEMIAEDLSPVVGVMDYFGLPLLASFDGITLDDRIIFEHKLHSKALSEFLEQNQDLPDTHWPQVEHQLLISGADHCIFVVSDGTHENQTLIEYCSKPERQKMVIEGWMMFQKDLEQLKSNPPADETEKHQATTQEALPALTIELEGKVLATNLDQFKQIALDQISQINKDLTSDEDFVQAESDVKFLKEAIKNIDDVKDKAISSTADIKAAFDALDEVRAFMNRTKLDLEKDVKGKKEQIKKAVKEEALQSIYAYKTELESQLSGNHLKNESYDLAINEAVKGKRTLKSVREACDNVVTQTKLKLNDAAKVSRDNLALLDELASDYAFLFSDFQVYINQETPIVREMIESRVANHKAEEEAKKQATEEAAAQAEIDAANAEELEEIEQIADSLTVEESFREDDEPIFDTQGMTFSEEKPVVSQARAEIYSNDFPGFSLADIFAEYNLAAGKYSITIAKVGE